MALVNVGTKKKWGGLPFFLFRFAPTWGRGKFGAFLWPPVTLLTKSRLSRVLCRHPPLFKCLPDVFYLLGVVY